MVTIDFNKYKKISRKLSNKIFGKNTLYSNITNQSSNDCIVRYTDIITNTDTNTHTLKVTGYRGMYKFGLSIIDSKINIGKSRKYDTVEEAKAGHNSISLISYHKGNEQYNKDIDKSISQISNKKLSLELSNFLSTHYAFNYFITLTFAQTRYVNKENLDINDKEYIKQQDYLQHQTGYSLDTVTKLVLEYLKGLKRYKGSNLIDYYFVAFEKTIKGYWHAHIATQISNTSKEYWTTYLTKRWSLGSVKTKKIRKDTPTKENKAIVIEYLTKDSEHKNLDIVSWDTNITKNSKRKFTLEDLNTAEKIDYWLATDNALTVLNLLPHLPITQQKQTA